jgi:acyl-CoA hydrolase
MALASGEDPWTGEGWPCVTAYVTFVGVEDDRKPVPVPAAPPGGSANAFCRGKVKHPQEAAEGLR